MFSHVCPDCSLTVTLAPLCDTVPFHELVMVCPLANVQVSDQPVRVLLPPFLMPTVAPNWLLLYCEIE
jgi:hypothetical protein